MTVICKICYPTFPQEQEISLACNILRGMANDPKEPGSKSENSSFESRAVEQQGQIEEVKKSENKVTNGAGAAPIQEKNVNKKGKAAGASRTFVISAEEMEAGPENVSFFYQPFLSKGMLT